MVVSSEAPRISDTELAALIREVPDFPKIGILFKDITTLLKDARGFRSAIDAMVARFRATAIDQVVAVESRGFIFGAPIAYELGAGFVPVRKLGKLPAPSLKTEYQLEYGSNTLEIHIDAIQPGERVLIVDDLLATGGSVAATTELVRQLGGQIVGASFLVELTFLNGRAKLRDCECRSLIQF